MIFTCGKFEVVVKDAITKQSLRVVEDEYTKLHVVAKPDMEYFMTFKCIDIRGLGSNDGFRVDVFVDGKKNPMGIMVYGPEWEFDFHGFHAGIVGNETVVNSFKFVVPPVDETMQLDDDDAAQHDTRRITIKVYAARRVGPAVERMDAGPGLSIPNVPEYKEAPALVTGVEETMHTGDVEKGDWQVEQQECSYHTFCYTTAASLLMRGLLDKNNSAHRAVIDEARAGEYTLTCDLTVDDEFPIWYVSRAGNVIDLCV